MPKKEYALDAGGPKRLTVEWSGIWKNFTIKLDGKTVGTIPDQSTLKQGRDFALPDGSKLHVVLKTGLAAELQMTRDGLPLPGSASDPSERLRQAWMMIFFIAGLNAVLGILAELFKIGFLLDMGVGWPSVILGLIYAGLGAAVRSLRSQLALAAAVLLFAGDGLAGFAMAVSAGGNPPVGAIIFRVFLLIPMVKGFGAIRALKGSPLPGESVKIPAGVGSQGKPWDPPRRG